MAKKHIHAAHSKLQLLSPWYLLGLALVFGTISLFAMRQNNLKMLQLRNDVFAADKANGDVETALRNLREFIYSHMNTNLDAGSGVKPPIQLQYRYNRLVSAEKERVKRDNANVYKKAEQACQKYIINGYAGPASAPCIRNYVNSHLAKEQPIPEELYKFDFASPAWAPDLAGWTLLSAILLLFIFIARFSLDKWVKHDLQKQL